MDNLNIKLTIFGLERTLKEVMDDLANATMVKTSRSKDKLTYKALGEVKTLYNVLEVKVDKDDKEDISQFDKRWLIEACKKQIPQKPYYRKEEDAEGYACPVCDMGVTVDHGRIRDTFCSHCGQA